MPAPTSPASATPDTGGSTASASHRHDIDHEAEALAAAAAAADADADTARRGELHERLVLLALPMADALARRYANRGIEEDDLTQVARTALVKAVQRYRPGGGPGFTAYAVPTISGELKRWFRDHGWAVRPSRRVQELRPRVVAAEDALRTGLSRHPRREELADALGVSVAEVAEVRGWSAGYRSTSLDAPLPSGTPLGHQLLVTESRTDDWDTLDALGQAVGALTPREQTVVRLRFVEERTQSEIGRAIGVSQMQVSRLLTGILGRLRASLSAADADWRTAA